MDLARHVVDAVVLEGRSYRDVARAHGVSKRWVGKIVGRFREGLDHVFGRRCGDGRRGLEHAEGRDGSIGPTVRQGDTDCRRGDKAA